MNRALRTVVLASLCLLCICSSRVTGARLIDSSFELARASFPFLPFYPPMALDLAVVTLTADEPIHLRAGYCLQGSDRCNESNFVPCCAPADCDPTLLQRRPGVAPSCVCPSTPGSICLDPTRFITLGASDFLRMDPFTEIAFEIPLARACHTTVINLNVLRGNSNLYLGTSSMSTRQVIDAPLFLSEQYTSNAIALCATEGDGSDLYSTEGQKNDHSRFLKDVAPDGAAEINITVSEVLNPLGLVPLHTPGSRDVNYALAFAGLFCESAQVLSYARPKPPPFFPLTLAATSDPLYDFSLSGGYLAPLSLEDINPNQAVFVVPVGSDVQFVGVPILPSPDQCVLDLGFLAFADNSSLVSEAQDPIPLSPTYAIEVYTSVNRSRASDCNASLLQAKQSQIAALAAAFPADANPITYAFAEIWAAGGADSSTLVGPCEREANQLLSLNTFVANTSDCTSELGSPEYFSDPCCNVDLRRTSCCLPSVKTATTRAASDALVSAACAEPACSSIAADTIGQLLSRQQLCTEESASGQARTFDLLAKSTQEISLNDGPCADAFESSADDELIACIVSNLDPAYKAEFFTLWRLNPAALTFEEALRSVYASRPGCLQTGVRAFDTVSLVPLRNNALDGDRALCESTPSCNWLAGASQEECEASYRGPMMCASCGADGLCNDFTVVAACYSPRWVVNWTESWQASCISAGGLVDAELGCHFRNRSSSRSDCLASPACGAGSDSCPPVCYFPNLTEATCACPAVSDAFCGALTYDAAIGLCVLSAPLYDVDATVCASLGGEFWTGAVWQAPQLADEASCIAAGVYCPLQPGATQAECDALLAASQSALGSCDVHCPGCNQTECEASVGCRDRSLFDTPSGEPTCVSDVFLYGTNIFGCFLAVPADPALGCVYNDAVTFLTGPEFAAFTRCDLVDAPAIMDQARCEAFGRCKEASFGNGVTTPKSRDECAACGGEWLQAFTWGAGNYTPAAPSSLATVPVQWVPRAYRPRYAWTVFFNRSGFAADFYTVRAAQQIALAKQTRLCRSGGTLDLISQLACDCGDSQGGADCFADLSARRLLSLVRACEGAPSSAVVSGTLNVTFTGLQSFDDPCVDARISAVPRDSLASRNRFATSSLFVASLARSRYAVVKDDKGVVIGEIAGDGIRIDFSPGDGAAEITILCLPVVGTPDATYPVTAFAVVDARY